MSERNWQGVQPLPEAVAREAICSDPGVVAGQIWSAIFLKADGSVRKGTFRLHVSKGVTGEGRRGWPQTPGEVIEKYDMISVFDQSLASKLGTEEKMKEVVTAIARACGAPYEPYERKDRAKECYRFIKFANVLYFKSEGRVLEAH